jgi:hypothetical protein
VNERTDVPPNRNARTEREPLDRPGESLGRKHFSDAVDLAHAATLLEWAGQPARICDVAKTIDIASDSIVQATAEYLDAKFAKERKITAAQISALEKKVDASDARSTLIKAENVNLRTEVGKLTSAIRAFDRTLSLDRARRGERRPKLPAAAKTTKTKPNGAKPPDGATLPDFIVKSAATPVQGKTVTQ